MRSYSMPEISFEVGDAKQTGLADASVDFVLMHTLLCHVPGPQDVIREAFRVLKPGGVLACTVHQDLWQSLGFETAFETLVQRGVAEKVSQELGSYFGGSPPEGWFCVYRRISG